MLNWIKTHLHGIRILLLFVLIGLAVMGVYSVPIKSENRPIRIVAIGKASASNTSFWGIIKNGMDAAALEYDVSVEYRAPDNESQVARQIDLVYEAIAEKPDALLLAALDKTQLVEPARSARAAGIPVIMFDSNIETSGSPIYDSFIATDNIAAGEKLGDLILQKVPEQTTILIVSPSTKGDSLIGRETGVLNRIEGHYIILPTLDVGGGVSEVAHSLISQVLADHPEIGGIISLNEYTTVGATRAVRGAGLTGKIVVVGFDSSVELINYLEEGLLSAIVIQRPFNMGYLSVVSALDVLEGRTVEHFHDTGSILITKDTIYQEENAKLLFPFE